MRTTHWRVFLTLGTLTLLLLFLANHFGGRFGLFWMSVIVISLLGLIYFYFDSQLENVFERQRVEGQDPHNLERTVHEICDKARLPYPEVFRFKMSTPLAWVCGRSWQQYAILVSDGALEKLDRQELYALLCLELAKVKTHSHVSYTVASGLAGGLLFWLKRKPIQGKVQPWNQNFFTDLLRAIPYFLFTSSQQFFASDKLAAEWVKDPKLIARTLWKVEGYIESQRPQVPPSLAPLFSVNPLTKRISHSYFLHQPLPEDRIFKLVGYYPV